MSLITRQGRDIRSAMRVCPVWAVMAIVLAFRAASASGHHAFLHTPTAPARPPSVDTIDHTVDQRTHASYESTRQRQTFLPYKTNVYNSPCTSEIVLKHPLFFDKNVHSQHFHIDAPRIWESTLPPVDIFASVLGIGGGRQLRNGVIGKDVTVEFNEAQDGAKELLEGCGIYRDTKESICVLDHLTSVLSFYQEIVSYGGEEKDRKCKARIVSTRGHVGTKCPRWHADHVPVRLVMSLIGPGCVFIPETLEEGKPIGAVPVDRVALNGLDLDDTAAANRIIVPDEKGTVHSSAGDAVLLMGREWEDCSVGDSHQAGHLHAAVHKSPTLDPFQGRVLLVVDIVPN